MQTHFVILLGLISTDWFLDIPTAVLAFVTTVLAGVAYLQLRAMWKSEKLMDAQVKLAKDTVAAAQDSAKASADTVNQMRDTAARELRASVFVESANRFGNYNSNSYTAEITIKNFGKVSAEDCTYDFTVVHRPSLPDPTAFPPLHWSGRESKMVLPPNGIVRLMLPMLVGTFGTTQHTQVTNGASGIYVYGEIRYRDGFSQDRVTKFRLISTGLEYNHGRFSFCPQGNEAN